MSIHTRKPPTMVTGGSKPHPPQCNLRRHPFKKTASTCRHTRLSKSETCTGHKAICARPRAHKFTTSKQACQAQAVMNKEEPNHRPRSKGPTRGTLQQQPKPLAPCIAVSHRCFCCQLLLLLLLPRLPPVQLQLQH